MSAVLEPNRGQRKVTNLSPGRLEDRDVSTSSSLASTVAIPSPSVRRSARIRDSPSINYRDTCRYSLFRDSLLASYDLFWYRSSPFSKLPKKRIFGLDNTDLDLSKQFNGSFNISKDVDTTELNQPDSDSNQRKSLFPRVCRYYVK